MRTWIRKLWKRAKDLWALAKSERASPRQIGWAVAVGAFVGCTPAVGFHGWLALGAGTALRLNRLFTWLGSRISNMVFMPFIVLGEIQVGTLVRTGHLLPLTARDALARGPALILDWCLGCVPVGVALGATLGVASYALARRRASLRRRTPA